MNFVAATLLANLEDEEEAFWMFSAVVEEVMPPDYYTPTMTGAHLDQLVLLKLLRRRLPRLARAVRRLGVQLPLICMQWFLSAQPGYF